MRLSEAGALLGIKLLDRAIVSDSEHYSFNDAGVLCWPLFGDWQAATSSVRLSHSSALQDDQYQGWSCGALFSVLLANVFPGDIDLLHHGMVIKRVETIPPVAR